MLVFNIIFLISIIFLFKTDGSGLRPDNNSQIIREQHHVMFGQKVLCKNPNIDYVSNSSCHIKLKSRDNQVYSFELNLHPNVSFSWLHVSLIQISKIVTYQLSYCFAGTHSIIL